MATRNAAQKGRGQRRVHRLAQLLPPDLGQVSQGDADDQRGLDPFSQRNDEGLNHLRDVPIILKMNFNFNFKDMLPRRQSRQSAAAQPPVIRITRRNFALEMRLVAGKGSEWSVIP